jgi:hypothetical protein
MLAASEAADARWRDKTPDQKLRWLLDFAAEDLSRLYPEERVARGYDLAAIAFSGPHQVAVMGVGASVTANAVAEDYQPQIRDGLAMVRAAMGGEVETWVTMGRYFKEKTGQPIAEVTLDREWLLPGQPTLQRDGAGFRIGVRAWNDIDAILVGVAELLVRAGHHLRLCRGDAEGEGCGQLFVRVRRQIFCSATCAQRARNLRKAKGQTVMKKSTPKKGGGAR